MKLSVINCEVPRPPSPAGSLKLVCGCCEAVSELLLSSVCSDGLMLSVTDIRRFWLGPELLLHFSCAALVGSVNRTRRRLLTRGRTNAGVPPRFRLKFLPPHSSSKVCCPSAFTHRRAHACAGRHAEFMSDAECLTGSSAQS